METTIITVEPALHAASYQRIVRSDIESSLGDLVSSQTRLGHTALHIVAKNKNSVQEIERSIPNADEIQRSYFYGLQSLRIANSKNLYRYGREDTRIERFAEQSVAFSREQNKAVTKMLLSSNADVNAKDQENCSPLQCAVYTGDTELVLLLIEAGANINNQNNIGATPLHDAVLCGNKKMVRMLLKYGAKVTLQTDCKGDTALHWAAMLNRRHSHDEIIVDLMQYGSDPNKKNSSGRCPFSDVIKYGDVSLAKICVCEYGAEIPCFRFYM